MEIIRLESQGARSNRIARGGPSPQSVVTRAADSVWQVFDIHGKWLQVGLEGSVTFYLNLLFCF